MKTNFVTILFASCVMMLASCAARADEYVLYLTLVNEKAAGPVGYLVIKVPENRKAPSGWKMYWHVVIYAPSGHRINLTTLTDNEPRSPQHQVTVKLPPGRYRVEISHPPEGAARTIWDLDTLRWLKPSLEAVVDGKTEVAVVPDGVRVAEIRYDEPRTSQTPGDAEMVRMSWSNFRVEIVEGSTALVPTSPPTPHPLIRLAPFDNIVPSALVAALSDPAAATLARLTLQHDSAPLPPELLTTFGDGKLPLTWGLGRLLVRRADKRFIPALLARLHGNDAEPAAIAAWVLGELRDSSATTDLGDALEKPSPLIKIYAAYALAQIRNPAGLAALLKAAQQSNVCVDSTMIANFFDTEGLGVVLLDRSYKATQVQPLPSYCSTPNIALALGELGDPQAVPTLAKLVESGDNEVTKAAVIALGRFRTADAAKPLIDRLFAWPTGMRLFAIKALEHNGHKSAFPALKKAAETDTDELTRNTAKAALAKLQ